MCEKMTHTDTKKIIVMVIHMTPIDESMSYKLFNYKPLLLANCHTQIQEMVEFMLHINIRVVKLA